MSMKNTALSPQAQAVLDAFLAEWPDEALEQDRECLAAALRAVVKELKCFGITEKNILAIADELEGSPKENKRPDRLIAGDVWEFETEVKVKGRRKLQLMRLQFEVVGYHRGECAWQLKSLGGEHYTYLMECAPQYEDMTYIGPLDSK